MLHMKTIVITVFQASVVKNILRTDVIKTLISRPDVRVICLMCFPERVLHYQKELPYEHVLYDSFYETPKGILERFFSVLKFHLIKTATTDLRKKMHYEETGNYFLYIATTILNRLITIRPVRKLIRALDYSLIKNHEFEEALIRLKPDILVLTHLFDDTEIALLREAKQLGIQTVGYINSWDKITARCGLRILPDFFIVFNEIVKREVVEHDDALAEKIIPCGIPQYDQYSAHRPISREEFYKKSGLDQKKKLILFAPMGTKFSDSDWLMVDYLHSSINEKSLVPNAQLLVRFQPNDFIDTKELTQRPYLHYDLPGIRYGTERGGDWDMNFYDLQHLTNTLAHTDIVVSYASSISIDTALMKKPVININFELKPVTTQSKSPTFYYHTDHYKKALVSGGIRIVNSKEELIQWLNAYLKDPSLDSAGRERLVREQCWKTDGKSGERIAKTIFRLLDDTRP